LLLLLFLLRRQWLDASIVVTSSHSSNTQEINVDCAVLGAHYLMTLSRSVPLALVSAAAAVSKSSAFRKYSLCEWRWRLTGMTSLVAFGNCQHLGRNKFHDAK
jgi:hypothetical protein